MYKLMNLESIIDSNEMIYAHSRGIDRETLLQHSNRTAYVMDYFNKTYGIEEKLRTVLSKINLKKRGRKAPLADEDIDFTIDMFFNAVYLHDIGKINPAFQVSRMNNKGFFSVKGLDSLESHHAPLSAIIYINEYADRLRKSDVKEKFFVHLMMLYFANSIYCHHGKLQDFDERFSPDIFEEAISTYGRKEYLVAYRGELTINKNVADIFGKLRRLQIDFDTKSTYIIIKILNSVLQSSDYTATYSYIKDCPVEDFSLNLIEDTSILLKTFEDTPIYKGMKEFERDRGFFKKNKLPRINELRSDIALECSSATEEEREEQRIFNIEAPTGSGKTYNSLGCALKLLDLPSYKKLLYISPINAVSNQTRKEFLKIFSDRVEIQEINSVSPLPEKKDSFGQTDYEKTLLDRQLLNYPVTFTSHVALFDMLFGSSRHSSMALLSLFNSVIVLDEIQNYRNSIWKETIEMLYAYAEAMNIKIIIMSATLPNLQELVDSKDCRIVNLIKNPKVYYDSPYFKNRVEIDGSLLNEKCTFDTLEKVMIEAIEKRSLIHKDRGQIFLAEFITTSSAMDFYLRIKSNLPKELYEIYELDSNNSSYSKEMIIDYIKSYRGRKHLILVTTQVIEAGVDIDADLGMKDAVFPDVDEQFMGRINRSATKKDCRVIFFNLDDERWVYREDLRLGCNIKNDRYFLCLKNKEFRTKLYGKVLDRIRDLKTTSAYSDMDRFLLGELLRQSHSTIEKRMRLIDSSTINIFIPIKEVKVKDCNGEEVLVNGEDVWNEYTELVARKGINYAERRVLISRLKEKMSLFTFSVIGNEILGLEPVGGFYYIREGERFLVEGKLHKDSFKNSYYVR